MALCQPEKILFRCGRDFFRHKSALRWSERALCLPERASIGLRGPFVGVRVSSFVLMWPCVGLRGPSIGLEGHSVDLRESCVDPEMTFCLPSRPSVDLRKLVSSLVVRRGRQTPKSIRQRHLRHSILANKSSL